MKGWGLGSSAVEEFPWFKAGFVIKMVAIVFGKRIPINLVSAGHVIPFCFSMFQI